MQNLKNLWTCFRFCDVTHCKIVSTFSKFILISSRSIIKSRYFVSWTKNSYLSISICRSAFRRRCKTFLTCFTCFFWSCYKWKCHLCKSIRNRSNNRRTHHSYNVDKWSIHCTIRMIIHDIYKHQISFWR